jgi:hypothetical protein
VVPALVSFLREPLDSSTKRRPDDDLAKHRE